MIEYDPVIYLTDTNDNYSYYTVDSYHIFRVNNEFTNLSSYVGFNSNGNIVYIEDVNNSKHIKYLKQKVIAFHKLNMLLED